MLTHQRVCVLHVAATVATRCECLTGVSSFFQLFEPCKTGADGRIFILHRSDGDTKWSAMFRRFSFLEETSEKDETWWTASAVLTLLMVQTASLLLVWMWRNCVAKAPPMDQRCRSDGSWFAKSLRLQFFSPGYVGAGR